MPRKVGQRAVAQGLDGSRQGRLGGEMWCVGSGITSAFDPSFRVSAPLLYRAPGKSSGRNPNRANPGLKICGGGRASEKSGETAPACRLATLIQQSRRFRFSTNVIVCLLCPACHDVQGLVRAMACSEALISASRICAPKVSERKSMPSLFPSPVVSRRSPAE